MHRFGCGILSMVLLVWPCRAASFTPAGLQPDTVTAIAGGRMSDVNVIVAGVRDAVYIRSENGEFVTMHAPAFGAAHCLFLDTDGHRLFAGTDSGLYRCRFISAEQYDWERITDIGAGAVRAFAMREAVQYCATDAGMFLNSPTYRNWVACDVTDSLPSHQNVPSFTDLCFWDGTIAAGSRFTGVRTSWDGVLIAAVDSTGGWRDVSIRDIDSSRLEQVFALAAFAASWNEAAYLYAASAAGIYYRTHPDTNAWHATDPAFTSGIVRSLAVTFRSRSIIPDLFASGDSGCFLLAYIDDTREWRQLSGIASYGVAAHSAQDPNEWFVATADGVYRYSASAAVASAGTSPARRGASATPYAPTLLNGRAWDPHAAPRRHAYGAVRLVVP